MLTGVPPNERPRENRKSIQYARKRMLSLLRYPSLFKKYRYYAFILKTKWH